MNENTLRSRARVRSQPVLKSQRIFKRVLFVRTSFLEQKTCREECYNLFKRYQKLVFLTLVNLFFVATTGYPNDTLAIRKNVVLITVQ
jgi:hypothetical protein